MSAKKRVRATHRPGDVPPPPSPASGPQGPYYSPEGIFLNPFQERPEAEGIQDYGGRSPRDSGSSGSIPVGLNTSTDEIIVTPLDPAPAYSGRSSRVDAVIPLTTTVLPTVVVNTTPLVNPEVSATPTPSIEPNSRTADTHGMSFDLHVGHQVPPYANDVRAERRRREREEVRNRHRGIHAAPVEFNDRMWVE